jgi:outer membrane protein OmpA-like peptidoglycan-associated protein
MTTFCTSCGTKLVKEAPFCTSCGAKTDAPEGPHADAESIANSGQGQQPVAAAANSSRPRRLFLFGGGLLLIFSVAGITAAVYVGHRVKERISDEIHGGTTRSERAGKVPDTPDGNTTDASQDGSKPDGTQSDGSDPNIAKGLDTISSLMDRMGFGDPPPNPYSDLPTVKSEDVHNNRCANADSAKDLPAPSAAHLGPSGIPMRKGLVLVHAWGRKSGDSESINGVTQLTDRFAEISDSGTYFQSAEDVKGTPGSDLRDVCTEDLQTAHGLMTGFGNNGPRTEPGTTTVDVSQAVFSDLKTRGKTQFRYLEWIKADLPDAEGYLHWEGGDLARVEAADVPLPVIVNGTPTTLPAIHAAGTLLVEDKKARETSNSLTDKPVRTDIFILDDPRNPLLLLYKMDVNEFRVQVTEIKFPVDKPVTKIEDDLLRNKKVVIYGIYFDYNSDQIKKESEPVLREIAAAMKNNPDWKLTVDGHTDSIGGDAYNLDLSKRRAAAVKEALVDRFQIGGDRLVTDGFGMRRPVDRNDTIEGRARNRRVELTRE